MNIAPPPFMNTNPHNELPLPGEAKQSTKRLTTKRKIFAGRNSNGGETSTERQRTSLTNTRQIEYGTTK